MSTNFQKQEKEATENLRSSGIRIIRRAKKKRITQQVRIPVDIYEKITNRSREEKRTRSKMIESICRHFFKKK